MEPIIGKTNIYITPFGYQSRPARKLQLPCLEGFNIIAVGGMPYVSYGSKAVSMDRQNLDGFMTYNKSLVKDLIDPYTPSIADVGIPQPVRDLGKLEYMKTGLLH